MKFLFYSNNRIVYFVFDNLNGSLKLYEFIWFCLVWLIYVVVILLMYVFNVYRYVIDIIKIVEVFYIFFYCLVVFDFLDFGIVL